MPSSPLTNFPGDVRLRWPAILLDIGGVVLHPDGELLSRRLEAVGISVDGDTARRAFADANAEAAVADDPLGFWSERTPWGEAFARSVGIETTQAATIMEVIAQGDEPGDPMWTRIEPNTVETLRWLRANGARIAAVSNASGNTHQELDHVGILELFDVVLDSALEGSEKPDPHLYERALDLLGFGPREAMYIGDELPEIIGAREVGIEGLVVYDPWATLPPVEGTIVIASLAELVDVA